MVTALSATVGPTTILLEAGDIKQPCLTSESQLLKSARSQTESIQVSEPTSQHDTWVSFHIGSTEVHVCQ